MSTRGFSPNAAPGKDPRLERLVFLADGVFAIALTLLAVELVLPEATANLQGDDLLPALLATWPKAFAYANSFVAIAIFWQAHHRLFLRVRRFDGVLMWLVFSQLACIAFLPFPTSVIDAHVENPVAQEFYFGALFVNGAAWAVLYWYATAKHRLVDPDPGSSRDLRLHLRLSLSAPAVFLLLVALVAAGVGRLINPLLLGCLLALGYIVFSARGAWEQRIEVPEEREQDRESKARRRHPTPEGTKKVPPKPVARAAPLRIDRRTTRALSPGASADALIARKFASRDRAARKALLP